MRCALALKITHELADMRRHLWVKAPLGIVIDGKPAQAIEWSLGGIALDDGALGTTPTGHSVGLRVTLPFQGFDIGFDTKGVVERGPANAQRTIVSFTDLGQRERNLLSHFIEQLVRGNMTSVEETIQRLDAPLAVAAFASQPQAQVRAPQDHVRRWRPARAAMMTSLYGIAGIAAVGYLGSLLYTNLFWMEAQTSAISAPVENLVSLGDGVVTWAQFKPGENVKAGDVVLRIADNTLEREIEQAEISIRERENKLAFLARRYENEKKRLGTLSGLSSLKSAHTTAEIEGMQAKLQSAQRELKQLPATAVGPIAQVRQRIVALKQAISLKEFDASGRANLAREANGSHEIIGQSVLGDTDNLAAQIELAEADIAIAQRRHQSYLNQRDRLSLRAPFDGILRQLPHADSATVRKGDIAAVVERSAERGVTAYLRQEQVLRVQIGAQAIVHVPATRQTFRATVSEIDPAHGPKSDHNRHNTTAGTPARNDEGMAAVRLLFTDGARAIDLNIYRDGLPAVTMIGLSKVQRTRQSDPATRLGMTAQGTYRLVSQSVIGERRTVSSEPVQQNSSISDVFGPYLNDWVKASRPSTRND
jgi:multidrug resistance efflux pump